MNVFSCCYRLLLDFIPHFINIILHVIGQAHYEDRYSLLTITSNTMENHTEEYRPSKKIRCFDEIGKRISFETAAKILSIDASELKIIADFTNQEKANVLRALNKSIS